MLKLSEAQKAVLHGIREHATATEGQVTITALFKKRLLDCDDRYSAKLTALGLEAAEPLPEYLNKKYDCTIYTYTSTYEEACQKEEASRAWRQNMFPQPAPRIPYAGH
jgi:hypothetical protein